MRSVAKKYQIIQLGLCFFIESQSAQKEDMKQYMAYPYNVYIFPELESGSRKDVVLDIDTVNFHKQQRLDFNKWIYEGVPYISAKAEQALTDKVLEERMDVELQVCDYDMKRVEQELEMIKKWVEEGAKEEYVVTGLNGFLRKLLYKELSKKLPQLYHSTKHLERGRKEVILKVVTAEERKALEEKATERKLDEVRKQSGALKLLKLLVNLKAPIVGHNPIFDLMFIYSHLCSELPHTWPEFKQEIHGLFPVIYDTMLIFGDEKVKKLLPEKQSSALEAMYLFVSKSKELAAISINTDVDSKYLQAEHYHEAGYDSYITGYSFIKLMEYIGKEDFVKYKNQLYVHKLPYNYNLEGKEILHDNVI
jgi:hypothetical protein